MKRYRPTESAKRFHEARNEAKVLCGPLGSGKSTAALVEFVLMASESEIPLVGCVVRASYRELRDTTRSTWLDWFAPISEWHEKDEKFFVHLTSPTGKKLAHELLFRSIMKPEDNQKIQGLQAAYFFLEECVPAYSSDGIIGQGLPEEVFEIASARLRQEGVDREQGGVGYTIVLTANPPSKSHWFYKRFIGVEPDALKKLDAIVIRQPAGENSPNLRTGYYDKLRAVFADEVMIRRFVDGDIVDVYDGEAVFPEARDQVHVVDRLVEPVKGYDLILGFDWGRTPATIITQVTPMGQLRILRELQSVDMGVDQHCEVLRTLMREYYRGFTYRSWGDPAGGAKSQTDSKTCFSVAESAGFPILPGKIDWASRREAVKQRLSRSINGEPAMIASRANAPLFCEGLLGAYRYPRSADGRVMPHPLKNMHSHIADAFQYLCTGEFSIRVDQEPLRRKPIQRGETAYIPQRNPLSSPKRRSSTSWMSR